MLAFQDGLPGLLPLLHVFPVNPLERLLLPLEHIRNVPRHPWLVAGVGLHYPGGNQHVYAELDI